MSLVSCAFGTVFFFLCAKRTPRSGSSWCQLFQTVEACLCKCALFFFFLQGFYTSSCFYPRWSFPDTSERTDRNWVVSPHRLWATLAAKAAEWLAIYNKLNRLPQSDIAIIWLYVQKGSVWAQEMWGFVFFYFLTKSLYNRIHCGWNVLLPVSIFGFAFSNETCHL